MPERPMRKIDAIKSRLATGLGISKSVASSYVFEVPKRLTQAIERETLSSMQFIPSPNSSQTFFRSASAGASAREQRRCQPVGMARRLMRPRRFVFENRWTI